MLDQRKEFYIKLIKESNSLADVCRKSSLCLTTGNYNTLKNIIKENNIDISHFKRCGSNSNMKNIDINKYLNNEIKISSFKLKNKLFKLKLKEHKCECCGLTEWLGKPINLELHHIDGNNENNNICNLQILCPNCHSYTDNYSGKNQKSNIIKNKVCIVCGKEFSKRSKSLFCSKECREKHIYGLEPLTIENVKKAMIKFKTKKDICSYLNRNHKVVNKFIKNNNL